MKNIILFIPYGSVGGMERLALTFYNFYKKQGYNVKGVKIIGRANDIVSFGEDEIILSRKDFSEYSKLERLKFYFEIPKKLREIILKYEISYTISFGDMANCFSLFTNTGEQKVASIHAIKSIEFKSFSLLNLFFKYSLKLKYNKFKKVVAISKAIKQDLVENLNYSHDNLEVIYNPHDIETIKKMSEEPISDKFERDLINSQNVILFLGRLSIQKSPWHLIKALYLLKNNNFKLVFIGDGDEKMTTYLEKLIIKLELNENVFFLGGKKNPYPYLQKAEFLALTSLYEGTPNVIAESIILKVPVITSLCTSGITEMMSDGNEITDGNLIITKTGIITPNFFKGKLAFPHDDNFISEEKDFADAIRYLLLNKESFKKRIENSWSKMIEKYSLFHVCNEYLK